MSATTSSLFSNARPSITSGIINSSASTPKKVTLIFAASPVSPAFLITLGANPSKAVSSALTLPACSKVIIDILMLVFDSSVRTIASASHLSTLVRLSCANPYANPVKK